MVQRFLLTRREAAEALGMSLRHFQRHVQPHLPCVYSGQLRLYRPQDLERWAEREAQSANGERSSDDRRAAGVGS
jgi:phage terminase Nu1 subunit (DNA packaging protein)